MWDWRWMLVGYVLGCLVGLAVIPHWLNWQERRRRRRFLEQVKALKLTRDAQWWERERQSEREMEEDIARFTKKQEGKREGKP